MEIQRYYDLSSLKATENINRTTLDYDDSVLPAGDFELYLRPGKTKIRKIVCTFNIKRDLCWSLFLI